MVHINAAAAAIVGALLLGKRRGLKAPTVLPHNVPFAILGAGHALVRLARLQRRQRARRQRPRRLRLRQHLLRPGRRRRGLGRSPSSSSSTARCPASGSPRARWPAWSPSRRRAGFVTPALGAPASARWPALASLARGPLPPAARPRRLARRLRRPRRGRHAGRAPHRRPRHQAREPRRRRRQPVAARLAGGGRARDLRLVRRPLLRPLQGGRASSSRCAPTSRTSGRAWTWPRAASAATSTPTSSPRRARRRRLSRTVEPARAARSGASGRARCIPGPPSPPLLAWQQDAARARAPRRRRSAPEPLETHGSLRRHARCNAPRHACIAHAHLAGEHHDEEGRQAASPPRHSRLRAPSPRPPRPPSSGRRPRPTSSRSSCRTSTSTSTSTRRRTTPSTSASPSASSPSRSSRPRSASTSSSRSRPRPPSRRSLQLNAKLVVAGGRVRRVAPGISARHLGRGLPEGRHPLLHPPRRDRQDLRRRQPHGRWLLRRSARTRSTPPDGQGAAAASWLLHQPGHRRRPERALQDHLLRRHARPARTPSAPCGAGVGFYFTPAIDILTGPVFFLDKGDPAGRLQHALDRPARRRLRPAGAGAGRAPPSSAGAQRGASGPAGPGAPRSSC